MMVEIATNQRGNTWISQGIVFLTIEPLVIQLEELFVNSLAMLESG